MVVRCATPYLNVTEDELLHGRLRKAVEDGRVYFLVDEVRLNTSGSPAHRPIDNLVAATVPLLGMVASIWHFGWMIGLGSVVVWAAAFLLAGRWVRGRVNARACRFALTSDAHLDELWQWGGLMLRSADGTAQVRQGTDWRNFARERC